MLDYIKAEIYRTRKTSNNKIMWVLGIAAIFIAFIALLNMQEEPTRAMLYGAITKMMLPMSIFMSMLIMGASFKEGYEEKNYVEKGFNRSNIIFGDLIVAAISTITKAIAFVIITYVMSLFLKDVDKFTTFHEFCVTTVLVVLMVLTMNFGTYMFYNITGKSGVASTLSFFMYMLLPQIALNFMNYDNFWGKICKFLVNTWPIEVFSELGRAYFMNTKIENVKYIVIMIIINIVIFNIISFVAKKRKRY